MTVYVLGAGASKHAGYPLASSMGKDLIAWMKSRAASILEYSTVAAQIEETFPPFEDLDDLFEQMSEVVQKFVSGTVEQRMTRALVARQRYVATEAIRECFLDIRRAEQQRAYEAFAQYIFQSGDCVLTFNYDVSLDRELKKASRWDVGDGYGFIVDSFPTTPTRLLKLHGSTNWLALMDGLPRRGFAQVSSAFASPRPAIAAADLEFLGYPGRRDAIFPSECPALPAMIAGRNKRFFFETSFGPEWGKFWRGLWEQAATAMACAERIVICGYSLPAADVAARDLLLSAPRKDAEIEVVCGDRRSDEIVNEYKRKGCTRVRVADQRYFEDWVSAHCRVSEGQRPATNDQRRATQAGC
jgi:hypothetical protein